MEGSKIKEAQFTEKYLLEDDIWKIFNYVFSPKVVNNTSYKFTFLISIIECAYNEKINLDYLKISRIKKVRKLCKKIKI